MQDTKQVEVTDKFNPDKVWIIKKYPCGHYYLNQKIKGRMFNKRFQKVTKKHIEDIGLELN